MSATGSLVLRLTFPNSEGRLVPGLFARVRLPVSPPQKTFLVSDRAIGTDQSQKFVLTVDAALEAARLRLRPILMTSIAFIAGVFPLVISSGAGAEMRHAMGVAVFTGMIGVTVFGLFLTPIFYVVLEKLGVKKPQPAAAAADPVVS